MIANPYKFCALLYLSFLLSTSACARRGGEDSSPRSRTDLVKGQIFIVTRSRENVKLGLVSVQAFSDSMILGHIASKRATADSQRKAIIQPQIDAAQSSLAEARQRLKAATLGSRNADANADAAERRMLAAHGEELERAFSATINDIVPAHDLVVQRERELHARAAELTAVQARYDTWGDSGEFYLEGLPRALTEAKSDANGEFVIQMPSDRPVVLAAFAQRQVFDRTENYCWLVRVPVGAARRDKLLLSNDNLTTANSPLSVIHTVK